MRHRLLFMGLCAVGLTHIAFCQSSHPIFDPILKMNALNLTAPANWKVQGLVLPGSGCVETPMDIIRASSPDGLSGYYALPRVDWSWSNIPNQKVAAGCMPWHQTVSARQYLTPLLPMLQVNFVRELDSSRELALDYRMSADATAKYGRPMGNSGVSMTWDAAKFLVRYQINGQMVDEIIQADIMTSTTTMQMGGNFRIITCAANVQRLRAPQGKLPADMSVNSQVKGQWNPDWANTWQTLWWQIRKGQIDAMWAASTKAVLAFGDAAQAVLTQQHEQYMQSMDQQRINRSNNFTNQMYNKQHATDNFVDHIFDCTRLSNNVGVGAYCPDRQTAPYPN